METGQRTEILAISDEELKSLTDAIHRRHGIDFSCYEPKSLKRRVVRALSVFKYNSVFEMYSRILKEDGFIYAFMDEISVGLTAMFRDPILWKKMRQLLNVDFASKNKLSIWHAGCSTGEEVYTLGIVIRESNYNGEITAKATDISNQSMEIAKAGEYHNMKLEEYDKNLRAYNPMSMLKKYYTDKDSSIKMNSDLIKHVTFGHHNLIKDDFIGTYDVIFCRNVMIYFDTPTKEFVVDKLCRALKKGGHFIIGGAESLSGLKHNLKYVEPSVYLKP